MTDKPVNVTGGCLCGEVRYEAQVFIKSGYICHCRICQRSSGQPIDISVPIRAGTLKFVKGEPRYYVSSKIGRRGFCGTCGSRIGWQALDKQSDWLSSVTVGSLDDPAAANADCHIFVDAQLPWFRMDDSLPKYREAEVGGLVEQWRQKRAR